MNSLELKKKQTDLSFSHNALSHLSIADKILFEKFGKADLVDLPFKCIHHAFEHHAYLRPEQIALKYKERSITYGELNKEANFLAANLIRRGVNKNQNVGLFLNRSIEMVIGILAILKTGATYVPQDIRITPLSQLNHIIDVANIDLVLSTSSNKKIAEKLWVDDVLFIDSLDKVKTNLLYLPSSTLNQGEDHNCFILFTSGTTGVPNGVQVTHKNVCNIIHTNPGNLNISPGVKVAQILNIAFDMAIWEIFACLSFGGTLYIRGKNIQETVSKVDVVIATPSILSSLEINKCKNILVAAVAGEPCPRNLADSWSEFCSFYNSCGPTETTIVNTMQRHNIENELLTIGAPTPNNTVYILNEDMSACKIGEVGEMWAGGLCVSKGYLENDDLNNKRYKRDPFLNDGSMMFRTRDLGRWTLLGELEHLGRTDDQVKIKGFRVELDSISNTLEALPGCLRACTLMFDKDRLITFVASRVLNEQICKDELEKKLAYYYIPEKIVIMDSLPKTSRGKIDKKRLLELAGSFINDMDEVYV